MKGYRVFLLALLMLESHSAGAMKMGKEVMRHELRSKRLERPALQEMMPLKQECRRPTKKKKQKDTTSVWVKVKSGVGRYEVAVELSLRL